MLLPFSTLIAVITFVGVNGLMLWSLYLMAQNKTQVEYAKGDGMVRSHTLRGAHAPL